MKKKVLDPIKKQFRKAKKHPRISTAAVLMFVLLISGLSVLVFTGAEDDGPSGPTSTEADKADGKDPGLEAAKKRKVKPAPVVDGRGTLDVARSVGRLALAQGRGRIKNPTGVRVRVSAAPKQTVTVDWQLSCYKATGKTSTQRIDSGRYRTRPPNTRAIPLPLSGADECTATVGVQLTRNVGSGRVKVAILAGG